jgi:hypothetical protein
MSAVKSLQFGHQHAGSGSGTWIRIRIDVKYWIRIRIESNADPQHCFKGSSKLSLII